MDGSRIDRSGIVWLLGGVLALVGLAGCQRTAPSPAPDGGESQPIVPASSPDQPAVRINRPTWKPYRLSLTPDGRYLATLDPGDTTDKGPVWGPRLIIWNTATGEQDYETRLVSLVESWREARPQRLRAARNQRRGPGRASRLLGSARLGSWAALAGLADFDLLEELGEQAQRTRRSAGSPTNTLVERFEPRGLFEQFRILDASEHPPVVSLQAGQFLDQDPRPLDDPKEEAAEFFVGFSVASSTGEVNTVFLPGSAAEAPRDGVFSADGRWAVLIADDRFEVTERETAGWRTQKSSIVTIPGKVRSLSIAADGSRLLVLCRDGQLLEWDTKKKTDLRNLLGPRTGLARVVLSGDGRAAVFLDTEGGLHLWDIPGDQAKAQWTPKEAVTQIALSADGRRVLFASAQGPPAIWNTDSTTEPRTLQDVRSVVALDLSADGKRAVAVEAGGGVLVWNLE